MAIINDSKVTTTAPEDSSWDQFKEKIKEKVDQIGDSIKEGMGIPPTPAPTAAPSATAIPEAPGNGGNEAPEGSDNKKLFIIGGAVLLVIIIGLVIWKSKK